MSIFHSKEPSPVPKEAQRRDRKTSCLVLLDFAENYHFIVQDEVQGYHWNKDQCTLHPVVVYYKDENNQLQHISLCVSSDDFVHELH